MPNITIHSPSQIDFLADNKTHLNRFEINSASSDRVYIVAQAKASGEWQCSCPGWIMKRPGKPRGCKHLKAMMPVLLQITAPAAKQLA